MSIFRLSVRQCYDSYVALCCRQVTQRTMLYRNTNEHGEAYRHGKKTRFLVSHNFFFGGWKRRQQTSIGPSNGPSNGPSIGLSNGPFVGHRLFF